MRSPGRPADGGSRHAPDGTRPVRVLVLCTGNSARSRIAEALLAARGGRRVRAASAGSHPAARVHPEAVAVLRARGVPWGGHPPRHIDVVIDDPVDLVITVCDDAREACPYFPGAVARAHWGLPDPAAAPPAAAAAAFAATYGALARRVDALLALPLERLDPSTLGAEAQALHDALA